MQIAEDLASRMDYTSGQVRYCLEGMPERLGVSRATIARHVSYLRELGSLAWVEHGTRANIRRALGLSGYAGTATVYAAVIPPVWDHAMGHRFSSTGAVIIDRRDSQPADEPVDNPPVENSAAQPRETPSRWVVKGEGKLQVVGGKEASTEQARSVESPRRRKKKKLTITGYKITGPRIERARQLAVSIRPLVNWIQGASHTQLSWVLLDLVARDWSEPQILLWLRNLGRQIGAPRWRPRFPHQMIAAALLHDDQTAKERTHNQGADFDQALRTAAPPNQDFQTAAQQLRNQIPVEPVVEYPTVDVIPETQWDRGLLREKATEDRSLVLAFARHVGREAALRVYGAEAARIIDAADEFRRAGFGPVLTG
jgi:hypothetical protein